MTNNDYAGGVTPVTGPSASPCRSDRTGPPSTCIVPVVFDDANTNNALNVAASNPAPPTEASAPVAPTTFSPGARSQASSATRTSWPTTTTQNVFDVCTFRRRRRSTGKRPRSCNDDECASFRYDTNDMFQLNGTPITLADFELKLSGDDDVRGTYADDRDRRRRSTCIDEGPLASDRRLGGPGRVRPRTAPRSTWNESATVTTDEYRIYRIAARTAADATCPATPTGQRS